MKVSSARFVAGIACSALQLLTLSAGGFRAADMVGLSPGKLRDFYRIGKMLGSGKHKILLTLQTGAFGEVRMCVHRETGAQRAVKVLRKSHMDDDEKKMLFNEINILRELVSRQT